MPRHAFSAYQDFKRFVLVDEMEGVKIITLRRPQAMNALSDEVNDEILAILKQYASDPLVRGFILTGYGTAAFSAGADIGKFPQMLGNREASVQYCRDCAKVQLFMDRMKKPVVAAVNGLALGGGLEIAIRCHAMVAMQNARFQLPEITLGILPGIGGCVVPYRKWPKGSALFHEMICLGRSINAKEAKDIGMLTAISASYGDLIQEALGLVNQLEGKVRGIPEASQTLPEIRLPDPPMAGKMVLSREAVGIAVRTIKRGAEAKSLGDALEQGYLGFGEVACTEAAKEGVSAFLEKRRPEFKK